MNDRELPRHTPRLCPKCGSVDNYMAAVDAQAGAQTRTCRACGHRFDGRPSSATMEQESIDVIAEKVTKELSVGWSFDGQEEIVAAAIEAAIRETVAVIEKRIDSGIGVAVARLSSTQRGDGAGWVSPADMFRIIRGAMEGVTK